ncbi:MAG: 23S rRNA (adenine(1618)-N(6))-methyltransferase RlmF [Holophagaceae bacterium]|nr:23S rRNA (adenine(1618)-N(6))-methyltransferase RlmF [Holophagaceae bacterium]
MRQRPGLGTPPARGTAPAPEGKPGLHPRNRHRLGYDFPALVKACPWLGGFLKVNPSGGATIDFADPEAVRALNRALLEVDYGVPGWAIPPGYLCPPVPGRADYLHHLADLLAEAQRGQIPRGSGIRVLDIGVGANVVYPLLGHREYGWTFVGSDTDPRALEAARRNLGGDPRLAGAVELRLQARADRIFEGVVRPGETFDLSLCNPPFHGSAAEARAGSQRKWRNLKGARAQAPVLNFGGQGGELWCPGGEAGFLGRMIAESARIPEAIGWFTSLVSKSANLPPLRRALRQAGATEIRVIPMAQGQKQSRILAWTFRPRGTEPGSAATTPGPARSRRS